MRVPPKAIPEPAVRAAAVPFFPAGSDARKAIPLFTFLRNYFPRTFIAMAKLSHKANEKHNPGEPMHWARGKSTDQYDCMLRHAFTPEEIDPETGQPECVAAAWRACAEAELTIERLIKEGKYTP